MTYFGIEEKVFEGFSTHRVPRLVHVSALALKCRVERNYAYHRVSNGFGTCTTRHIGAGIAPFDELATVDAVPRMVRSFGSSSLRPRK